MARSLSYQELTLYSLSGGGGVVHGRSLKGEDQAGGTMWRGKSWSACQGFLSEM